MNQHERDFFVYQTLAGFIRIKTNHGIVILKDPTPDILYEASELYLSLLDSELYENEEILSILYNYQIWSDDLEVEYREIPKKIENLKVAIYKDPKNKIYRKDLKNTEERMNELLNIRHSWDMYTKEGYASYIKKQFILEKTATINNLPVNPNIFSSFLYKVTPTDKQIRELSRTEPWLTHYEIGKRPDNEVGRRLIVYTKMYSNIREHPECPSEDIINDDDALDGWMILQRRNKEKNSHLNEVEKKLGKNKNKQQVLLPAAKDTYGKAIFRDIDEANKINNLNDERSKMEKQRILRKTQNERRDD